MHVAHIEQPNIRRNLLLQSRGLCSTACRYRACSIHEGVLLTSLDLAGTRLLGSVLVLGDLVGRLGLGLGLECSGRHGGTLLIKGNGFVVFWLTGRVGWWSVREVCSHLNVTRDSRVTQSESPPSPDERPALTLEGGELVTGWGAKAMHVVWVLAYFVIEI